MAVFFKSPAPPGVVLPRRAPARSSALRVCGVVKGRFDMAPYDISDGTAHLDAAHVGDIHGAFGSIAAHDHARHSGWKKRVPTLLAILGPGLIVMVGDNDAGGFGTYTQAGQNYGTSLMWTLLLLVPVLFVNQEMVLRLGVVTGVGHARLIFQRFGKFWGAFSVVDLFLLNALTIVTEFIGVTLGLDYLGLPKVWGVIAAALVTVAAASTGSFRRFERFMMVLVVASLALVPIVIMVHPPVGQIAQDLLVPGLPGPRLKLSDVMLLIIAIVGTTVAPWQLFFQQNYVVDKRITPRFMTYEKIDLWIGIALVVLGAVAMMAFTAAALSGTAQAGQFTDAQAVAVGLEHHAGRLAGVLFAIALIDASIIGAGAVSLATAYAIGDVFKINHSLHRKPGEAIGFYAVYAGLIAVAAALVLIPGTPLGLLTNAVQTLAGVLLPSATVFLLLLCNDKAVLGPWRNGPWLNLFTGAVIAVLVALSVILTASVLFPGLGSGVMLAILGASVGVAALELGGLAAPGQGRARADKPGRQDVVAHAGPEPAAAAAPERHGEGLDGGAARLSGDRRRPGAGAHRATGRPGAHLTPTILTSNAKGGPRGPPFRRSKRSFSELGDQAAHDRAARLEGVEVGVAGGRAVIQLRAGAAVERGDIPFVEQVEHLQLQGEAAEIVASRAVEGAVAGQVRRAGAVGRVGAHLLPGEGAGPRALVVDHAARGGIARRVGDGARRGRRDTFRGVAWRWPPSCSRWTNSWRRRLKPWGKA